MKALATIALFAGFGLLPLWVAIAIVWEGAEGRPATSEYWAAAPWLFFLAVPACLVTLGLAAIPVGIYKRGRSDDPRRLRRAAGGFLAACAAVALAGLLVMLYLRRGDDAREHLQEAAVRMVLQDPRVIERAGAQARASVLGRGTSRDSRAVDYRVYVPGPVPLHATVRASEESADAQLHIVCISLTSPEATPHDEMPCKDPL